MWRHAEMACRARPRGSPSRGPHLLPHEARVGDGEAGKRGRQEQHQMGRHDQGALSERQRALEAAERHPLERPHENQGARRPPNRLLTKS